MLDLSSVNEILNAFSIQKLGLNYIDLLIIIILIFYIYEGLALGFVSALFDFLGFILSFALGIKFYGFFGKLIYSYFSIPLGFSNAIGFFVAAVIFEMFLNVFSKIILKRLSGILKQGSVITKVNKPLGFIPGVFSAFVLSSFFLILVVALPVSPFLKNSVKESKIGSLLVSVSAGFEKNLNNIFGEAFNESLSFFTISPQSNDFVSLKFKTANFKEDPSAEQKMFEMVNKERTSRGFAALTFDNKIRDVAEAHSSDMFTRGYFSHYTPEKLSPFDRMGEAGVPFSFAGENLALAPSVDLAMQGLMNSPGHRANILSPNFKRIGIGVMDGEIYGEMFTQNFTD
ncbi:MAG: CvpA family protein [Patescibacteria group bacterium]|nr:CvpA family protein [Patescibacteria group bacterium]